MEDEVDSSKPFQGVVVCCTSIPPDQRTEIAQRTTDMGGTHKYDLTPDVTHLIVGDYDTPKYRHVAKERPDILPMAAGWIEDARNMWMADQEFEFAALEAKWKLKTFESGGGIPNSPDLAARERRKLLCCLTGFEDHDMRTLIEDKVRANGGEYVGDLSRNVTHLITHKPEGKKYMAALRWDIRAVSIEWLNDSVERGMILNESCYDPTLPQEERGVGAWTKKEVRRDTTGKRLRDDAASAGTQNRRKLRKTASMKFNSQNEGLWGDILNQQQDSPANQSTTVGDDSLANVSTFSLNDSTTSLSRLGDSTAPPTAIVPPLTRDANEQSTAVGGIFASSCFFVHGFPQSRADIICEYLTSHGGRISPSLDDLASPRQPEPPTQRFLVVPQASQPDTHPGLPPSDDGGPDPSVQIVTEFWIERCVHGRRLCDPADHVLGRPFPRFPLAGFADLTICTTGFANERLNQIEKTVVQLGARYAEKFNSRASVLVVADDPELVPKAELKLDFARRHAIPVVGAEWLWQCIAAGSRVPWDEKYLLQKLEPATATHSSPATAVAPRDGVAIDKAKQQQQQPQQQEKRKLQKTVSEPALPPRKPRPEPMSARRPYPPQSAWVDRSAFQDGGPAAAPAENEDLPAMPEQDIEVGDSHYETAPTQLVEDAEGSAVLKEASSNVLNNQKSPSSLSQHKKSAATDNQRDRQRKFKRFPTGGSIADSEAPDDDDDDGNDDNNERPQEVVAAAAADREAEEREKEAAARKHQQEERERQKQARTAREKQEMSRRLNSLMMMSSHDSSNGSGAGAGAGDDDNNHDVSMATVQRRKREVLGRAISNVSAASSNASAESSATAHINNANDHAVGGNGNKKSGRTTRTGSVGVSGSFMSAASGSGSGSGPHQLFDREAGSGEPPPEERPPPATQLQYDNPEARRHREVVMDRILKQRGGASTAAGGGTVGSNKKKGGNNASFGDGEEGGCDIGQQKQQKTLADLDADAVAGTGAGISPSMAGSVSSGIPTRRTSRRQKGF
ncbi:protein kinase activating protein dpb11 [Diatrype stigma]|uniref:Protein kinase activating protein dpb11 n=1 Tax=Diatrype stigma TaxID=117547 RepID=A0AAN9UYG3_9PEZI